MSFGAIMTWILWRFRPALWLDGVIARLIGWALRLLEDDDHQEWLNENPANCAWFGGWLGLGEARLNELIHYRACELLNLACKGRTLPAFIPARGVRTLDQAIARFARLAERYSEIERLSRLRAQKLKRLRDPSVIELDAIQHPPPPPPPLVVVLVVVMVVVAIFSAAGFSAQPIRAPPHRRTPENPPAQPAHSIGENERSCPKTSNSTIRRRLQEPGPASATPHPKKSRIFKPSGLWKSGFWVCPAAHKWARR